MATIINKPSDVADKNKKNQNNHEIVSYWQVNN